MALAVSPAATLLLGDVRWGFRGVLSLTGVACLGVACYAAALYVLCREDFLYYARRLLRELPPPRAPRGRERLPASRARRGSLPPTSCRS